MCVHTVPPTTAGEEPDDLDHDLSDISEVCKDARRHVCQGRTCAAKGVGPNISH